MVVWKKVVILFYGLYPYPFVSSKRSCSISIDMYEYVLCVCVCVSCFCIRFPCFVLSQSVPGRFSQTIAVETQPKKKRNQLKGNDHFKLSIVRMPHSQDARVQHSTFPSPLSPPATTFTHFCFFHFSLLFSFFLRPFLSTFRNMSLKVVAAKKKLPFFHNMND